MNLEYACVLWGLHIQRFGSVCIGVTSKYGMGLVTHSVLLHRWWRLRKGSYEFDLWLGTQHLQNDCVPSRITNSIADLFVYYA